MHYKEKVMQKSTRSPIRKEWRNLEHFQRVSIKHKNNVWSKHYLIFSFFSGGLGLYGHVILGNAKDSNLIGTVPHKQCFFKSMELSLLLTEHSCLRSKMEYTQTEPSRNPTYTYSCSHTAKANGVLHMRNIPTVPPSASRITVSTNPGCTSQEHGAVRAEGWDRHTA